MAGLWTGGLGGYERAPSPVGVPPQESPPKRLRGSTEHRLNGMEPPASGAVQPGGAVTAKRRRPADSARTVRARVEGEQRGRRVKDEIALDELEQKFTLLNATGIGLSAVGWGSTTLNECSAGTGVNARVGSNVIARRLVVRGVIHVTATNSETLHFRLVLLRDGQTENGAINTNTMSPFVGDGTFFVNDLYNPTTVGDDKRYQILADRTVTLQRVTSPLRHGFAFSVDLHDEVVRPALFTYMNPSYILCGTRAGALTVSMDVSAQMVFVDP